MEKESLDKIETEIIKILDNSNINRADKLELLINLKLFLENYEDNINILREYGKTRKKCLK